jgi:hypothetical protein
MQDALDASVNYHRRLADISLSAFYLSLECTFPLESKKSEKL